ncbi:MAG: SLAC1 anion channel family protein [Hydrogenovibrio sp.]|uniref:SLAC1 anion channel family protein n=1 Tax=Hydrogenovibrio sp. TaxID=2065821 RepID=UPI0028703574|nr:SLAC1 anion channel family protein [Hydrogenovibrio sp.]MDR9498194.1 SLAC1 anion channel family protein [Hydrogenovibrio sp.]
MSFWRRLAYFPAAFFGMTMGLGGLTLAVITLQNHQAWLFDQDWLAPVSVILATVTLALFVCLLSLYAIKALKHPQAWLGELNHPLKLFFVPTLTISGLLVSKILLELDWMNASFWLWLFSVVLHLLLTLWVFYHWLHLEHFRIEQANPAWFIPIVGNIVAPLAGVAHASPEVNWFFFSVGLFFWPILFAVLFYRIVFHPALMPKMLPTLFIFIAPPAIGFVSYMTLQSPLHLSLFGMTLYSLALFMLLLMLASLPKFQKLPFALSWWAYTFPIAAFAMASLAMHRATLDEGYFWLAAIMVVLLALYCLKLLAMTFRAMKQQKLCQPDD